MADNFAQYWKGGQIIGTLIEAAPAEITFDDIGVASAELNYSCLWDNAHGLVQGIVRHPIFPFLVRKSATITREEVGYCRVRILFAGIDPTDEDDKAKYSVEGSLSQEPIETHPDFLEMAGNPLQPSTWKNGAKFSTEKEDRGKFLGFTVMEGSSADNRKAGIRSFLEPGLIYSETRVKTRSSQTTISVAMNALGKIDNPPNSDVLPNVPSGRDWILFSCTVEEIGDGVRITKRWRLSGRNGWDEDIYN